MRRLRTLSILLTAFRLALVGSLLITPLAARAGDPSAESPKSSTKIPALVPGIKSASRQAWYSENLHAMNERRLEPSGVEVYRLLWLRTRHRPVSIRIEKRGDDISLVFKELDGMGGYEPGKLVAERTTKLSSQQWAEVEHAFDSAGFWSMPTNKEVSGRDGARWVVEGIRGDSYHLVDRWSVLSDKEEKPFARACRALFVTAGFYPRAKETY